MRGGENLITENKVSIGLTQFIGFTVKGSSAKTNLVRQIKNQEEYHPGKDYWKQLREGIKKFHEHELETSYFAEIIDAIDIKKKPNYIFAFKQYQKFLKNKDCVWFDPGKATWFNENLTVRSGPELGLYINGEPHLVKLFLKRESKDLNKRSSSTALTLLNTSVYEKDHDLSIKRCVLNLQTNRLYTDSTVNQDKLIALESEATQFMYIWNKI
jgi:hypothetical protein